MLRSLNLSPRSLRTGFDKQRPSGLRNDGLRSVVLGQLGSLEDRAISSSSMAQPAQFHQVDHQHQNLCPDSTRECDRWKHDFHSRNAQYRLRRRVDVRGALLPHNVFAAALRLFLLGHIELTCAPLDNRRGRSAYYSERQQTTEIVFASYLCSCDESPMAGSAHGRQLRLDTDPPENDEDSH